MPQPSNHGPDTMPSNHGPCSSERGSVRSEGGTLPGRKVSQQAGWARGGGRSGQERVRGKKTESMFIHRLCRPGAHAHPPPRGCGCSFGDTRKAVTLPQGAEIWSGSATTPSPQASLSPGTQVCSGDMNINMNPRAAPPRKQLEAAWVLQEPQDAGPGLAILRGPIICNQCYPPPLQ